MMRQNMPVHKKEWEKVSGNDDIAYKKINDIEGVKMAEAKELIEEAIGGLNKIDEDEKEFRNIISW
jgi:hypothetical protein